MVLITVGSLLQFASFFACSCWLYCILARLTLQNDVEDAFFWCGLLVLLVACHVFCKYRFFVVDVECLLICGFLSLL